MANVEMSGKVYSVPAWVVEMPEGPKKDFILAFYGAAQDLREGV